MESNIVPFLGPLAQWLNLSKPVRYTTPFNRQKYTPTYLNSLNVVLSEEVKERSIKLSLKTVHVVPDDTPISMARQIFGNRPDILFD